MIFNNIHQFLSDKFYSENYLTFNKMITPRLFNDYNKSQYYLDLSLSKKESYIRGEINLAEALDYLQQLGHKRKSIRKVLISTNRIMYLILLPSLESRLII